MVTVDWLIHPVLLFLSGFMQVIHGRQWTVIKDMCRAALTPLHYNIQSIAGKVVHKMLWGELTFHLSEGWLSARQPTLQEGFWAFIHPQVFKSWCLVWCRAHLESFQDYGTKWGAAGLNDLLIQINYNTVKRGSVIINGRYHTLSGLTNKHLKLLM